MSSILPREPSKRHALTSLKLIPPPTCPASASQPRYWSLTTSRPGVRLPQDRPVTRPPPQGRWHINHLHEELLRPSSELSRRYRLIGSLNSPFGQVAAGPSRIRRNSSWPCLLRCWLRSSDPAGPGNLSRHAGSFAVTTSRGKKNTRVPARSEAESLAPRGGHTGRVSLTPENWIWI